MSEKLTGEKMIDKMRANTDEQKRKTEGAPVKRSRRRLPKKRPIDNSEKQK